MFCNSVDNYYCNSYLKVTLNESFAARPVDLIAYRGVQIIWMISAMNLVHLDLEQPNLAGKHRGQPPAYYCIILIIVIL